MEAFLLSWKFKILFTLFAICSPYLALVGAGYVVIIYSSKSASCIGLYCSNLNLNTNIKITIEEYINCIYPLFNHKFSYLMDLMAQSNLYNSIAAVFTVYLLIISLIIIVFYSKDYVSRLNNLTYISFVLLLIGLFSPFLSFEAYKLFPIIGKTIFMFESRGVVSTIYELFLCGAFTAGLLILIFSIIFPVIKMLILILVINFSENKTYIGILEKIGKWSMADVFTAAILLAYLAIKSNKDVSTDAVIRPGWYFFAGYCILSLIVGHYSIHKNAEDKPKGIEKNVEK